MLKLQSMDGHRLETPSAGAGKAFPGLLPGRCAMPKAFTGTPET